MSVDSQGESGGEGHAAAKSNTPVDLQAAPVRCSGDDDMQNEHDFHC